MRAAPGGLARRQPGRAGVRRRDRRRPRRRRPPPRDLLAAGDADLAAACPGGAGCCGCWCWRPRSPTAGATRCRRCAPTSPSTSAPATPRWPAPPATCCAGPGRPTRRGRGDSTVPPGLRALGVTSREMDVLALVADGLTNAQVAERLFLSARTVETHVASLLAKTGAARRAELRARAGTELRSRHGSRTAARGRAWSQTRHAGRPPAGSTPCTRTGARTTSWSSEPDRPA